MSEVVKFLVLLASWVPKLAAGSVEAEAALTGGLAALKNIVEEKREPKPEQWALLQTGIEADQTKLHSDEV